MVSLLVIAVYGALAATVGAMWRWCDVRQSIVLQWHRTDQARAEGYHQHGEGSGRVRMLLMLLMIILVTS